MTTGKHVRFPDEVVERLTQEAKARQVSVNFLINLAVEDFLKHLLPVGEVRWTKLIHND